MRTQGREYKGGDLRLSGKTGRAEGRKWGLPLRSWGRGPGSTAGEGGAETQRRIFCG